MGFERGKSEFCLQFAGSPEEAIAHFNQAVDSQYRIQALDGQRYQADLRRYGFLNYLFRCMYPRMVYRAEAVSEYETRIHIDYAMPMRIRVMCHVSMFLSTALMHAGVNGGLVWWQAIALVFVGSISFLYEMVLFLTVEWLSCKKLAALCERHQVTPLWFEKSREILGTVTYYGCLKSTAAPVEVSALHQLMYSASSSWRSLRLCERTGISRQESVSHKATEPRR